MNNTFRYSMIFPRIDDFVLALHAFDTSGHTVEDFSIEGPPCVLVISVRHEGTEGGLLAIASDAMSTEDLFGEQTTQLSLTDLGLRPDAADSSISAIWSVLKAKYLFLERTELFLRNRNNFSSAFVVANRHWFAE